MKKNNISVYQGYDSDKYLDNMIKDLKSDYLVLSPHGNKNDKLLSEGDLMISLLEEFTYKVKNADANVPVFIYDVFGRIDESVDITKYLELLKNAENNVYISINNSYPTKNFEKFAKIFKI